MFRKTATVIGALLLLGSVGCQTQLDRVWTYGEFEDHAMKLDSEVAEFHSDVKESPGPKYIKFLAEYSTDSEKTA